MRKVTIWLFLIVMLPVKILARECTDRELANLKKIAANINYSYEYYLNKNKMYFDVTISNVYENIYILDVATDKKYSKTEFTIESKTDGQVLKFEIYSKTCDELLTTKTINLPAYNKYYQSSYCEGIREYKYCSKWGNYNFSEQEFAKMTKEYKESILIPEKEPEIITYKTEVRGFYVFISLFLLILLMYILFLFRKKHQKDII